MAPVPWMRLPAMWRITSWPNLRSQHALRRDLGISRGDADDVAPGDLAIEAEQQVGRGQMKEMHGVRLHDLTVVHQSAQLFGGRGQRAE